NLPRHGLPAGHRRMARAPGGHHDADRGRLFGRDMGRACPPRKPPVQTMKLLITGVSHKTAPVEVRECLAFREETLPDALADLKSREGVSEAVILSTCNRVEITVTTEDTVDARAIEDSFLADQKSISAAGIGPHLYRHEGREAIHHLFRLAASLDS